MESLRRRLDVYIRNQPYPEVIYPKEIFPLYKFVGIWRELSPTPIYTVYCYVVHILVAVHVFGIFWDCVEVSNDFITFGDDLCILVGMMLVVIKIWLSTVRRDELMSCIDRLQSYLEHYNRRGDQFRDQSRVNYLQEKFLFVLSYAIGLTLWLALAIQPFIANDNSLVFRARYPLDMESPVIFNVVLVSQMLMILYALSTIIYIDGSFVQILNQISHIFNLHQLEFEALAMDEPHHIRGPLCDGITVCQQLRLLTLTHQQLISFSLRINKLYEASIMTQFTCSTFIICLTAFEAMLTMSDMRLLFRFATFMLVAFYQLFLQSFFGNRIVHASLGINDAIERSNWIILSARQKKDLRFVLMRSQRPIVMRVWSYVPLTYDTFLAILSRSYSLFTLLRTVVK